MNRYQEFDRERAGNGRFEPERRSSGYYPESYEDRGREGRGRMSEGRGYGIQDYEGRGYEGRGYEGMGTEGRGYEGRMEGRYGGREYGMGQGSWNQPSMDDYRTQDWDRQNRGYTSAGSYGRQYSSGSYGGQPGAYGGSPNYGEPWRGQGNFSNQGPFGDFGGQPGGGMGYGPGNYGGRMSYGFGAHGGGWPENYRSSQGFAATAGNLPVPYSGSGQNAFQSGPQYGPQFGPGNYEMPGGRRSQFLEGNYGQHWGKGPRSYQRSDDRIQEDINDRLTEHSDVDATDIEVKVIHSEVTLSGVVEDRRTKRIVEDLAESVSGVKQVHNELRLQSGLRGSSKELGSTSSATGTRRGAGLESSQHAEAQTASGRK